MKPLTVAISIAVLALPLCANDQQAAVQKEDSVFVRAANASSHVTQKAKVVITDETLLTSGGYFTTTDATPPIPKGGQVGAATEDAIRDARAEADVTARREAAAMRLQLLRNDPAEYYRQIAEPRGVQRIETTMSATRLPIVTTTQLPQATNSAPKQGTTYQPGQMTTTPVSQMTPAQPEIGTAARPPER